MDKFTFIDLFSGCGGLSEGFLQSGKFEGLAHLEWDLPMVDTLRNRLEKKWKHSNNDSLRNVIHFDIQKTEELFNGNWSNETLAKFSKTNDVEITKTGLHGLLKGKKVNLIIGGPPCQAYSIAGRAQDKNGMKDDYRNYLFESFVELVNEFTPDAFVFENVPGLLSAKPGNKLVTERIYSAFEAIGYQIRDPNSISKAVYTASELGVPQKRNRVIIVGVKKGGKLNLESIYSSIDKFKSKKEVSVKDAIGHLPPIYPLDSPIRENGKNVSHKTTATVPIKYHEPRFHNLRDIGIFKTWVNENYNKRSSIEKIAFYNSRIGKSSNHGKYRNLEWGKPSPTIVAHLNKDGLMFIHPDGKQSRSITIKEAALLQSFPEDYEFIGSSAYCYKMIGNAVPPEMAKKIALAIAENLIER